MFYYEFEDDERQLMSQQTETPFTFGLPDGAFTDAADAAQQIADAAETAAAWLAWQGVAGARADSRRGRLWTAREASGDAFMLLLGQYRVRREGDHNLVDVASAR